MLHLLAAGADDTVDAGPLRPPPLVSQPLARKVDEARVERVMASLGVRGCAGQLVMAYPQINSTTPVEVGGVLFVGPTLKNIEKARLKIASARARARVPPFFAVDMEGGPSNRMKSVRALTSMPSAREMAQLDDAKVKQWGKTVGQAMAELGLNMNLAPVFDVSASGHMADNNRSFSGDPAVVVQKATAYSRGLLSVGVVPIGKHFPGYGNIAGDSDHALVVSEMGKDEVTAGMDAFIRAREVLAGVMLANVAYPAVSKKPAILSPELVAIAHQRDWLSVTDDLSIQLLADAIEGTSEDVLREAFLAGNDVLLTTAPPDWNKGLDYVGILTRLAQSGDKEKQLALSGCRRVLRLKDRMGLLDGL